MDIAKNICLRLKENLEKLKAFDVIHVFSLNINFGRVDEDLQVCLGEVEALLQKCLGKICLSWRTTELWNIISELVRRKNTEHSKFFEDDNYIMDCGDKECSAVRYSFCQDLELEKSMEKEVSIHKKSYLCEFCGKISLNSCKFKVHSCEGHNNENIETHEKGLSQEKMAQDGSLNSKCEMDNECKTEVVKNTVDFKNDFENTTHSSSTSNSENVSSTIPQNKNSTEDGVVSPTTETKSESFICSYESCNKMYRIEQSLKKHMRLKHSSGIKNTFFCDKCEKSFPEKGKLNRHVLSHERGQFECTKCPRTFYRMDHLRRHLLLLHENVKRFECQFCKKKFSLGANRDVHVKNVHMGEEIKCGSCGKMLKNETTYRQHKKIHDGNSFSCSFCSKRFLRKTEYRKHLMAKHKGKCPFQEFFNSFGEISFSDS